MRSFFKMVVASLLSLIIFTLLVFFFVVVFIGGMTSKKGVRPGPNSVLVLNLSQHYSEQMQENPLAMFTGSEDEEIPGLYDVVRLLLKAKTDKNISGIFIIANLNANGFAASTEIRNALAGFRESGKFVIAHGDVITQKAYAVAGIADKIYVSPQGLVEWRGFNAELIFFKGTLEKLNIQPQVFYAGKFKSATEPFRTDQMTPENEMQTSIWLNDLYNDFLIKASESRKIDTAILRRLANEGIIQQAGQALENKLVDGLKYDDEVKEEIRTKLDIKKADRINFISISAYGAAGNFKQQGNQRIALIYAAGTIIDGKGQHGVIGSEDYRNIIRKARLDKGIKAIVFRVNSGGGSALASENIWRELSLAKKDKPVVVSFGDVAASGGYYISCAADSIFAQPTTITGSIGVFGIIPNMEGFFKNKLGITFDGVKTAPYADALTISRPMNDYEKSMVQSAIENTYNLFKKRVGDGRKKDTAVVESLAQGRIWTGLRAKEVGLIDRFGGIEDAIQCAARMAKLKDFRVREYPEPENLFDRIMGKTNPFDIENKIKNEMGPEHYELYKELKRVQEMCNSFQTRMPFQFFIR